MKILASLRGALTAISLILIVTATSRAGLEEALPEECLVFVGVDDLERLKAGFDKTAWGRFLGDPGLSAMKESFRKKVSELGADAEEEAGVNPFDLLDMMSGSAAGFLLELGLPASGPDPSGAPAISMGFVVGVGEKGDEFLGLVDELFEDPLKKGIAVRENEEEGDITVTVIRDAEEQEGMSHELRYAVVDGVFLALIESEDLVEKGHFGGLVDGLAGESENPLSAAGGYTDSLAAKAEDGVRIYADLRRLIQQTILMGKAEGEMDEESEGIVEALSPEDLGYFSASLELGEEGTAFNVGLDWAGQGHLLEVLKALFVTGAPQTARLMPDKPLSANIFFIDLLAGLDAGFAAAREIAPEPAKAAQEQMEIGFQQEGFHVRTDLLANLAGEISLFTARIEDELDALPGTEDDPQSLCALISLKDGSKVESVIESLLRSSGMHAARKREEFQGHALYSLPIPVLGSKARYAILDDLLIFSPSAELIQDTLRRRGESGLPTLADNENFSAIFDAAPDGRVTAAGYNDSAASVRALLEGLKMVMDEGALSELGLGEEGLDFELPAPDLADKYFKDSSVSVFTVSEHGVRLTSKGP
ncbi:MAG: hypothetical protein V2A76_11675 [Planctomycetota bacterium]